MTTSIPTRMMMTMTTTRNLIAMMNTSTMIMVITIMMTSPLCFRWQCGFFRRNNYEKMKNEMKRDTRIDQDLVIQPDTEVDQHDGASQYDNELLREQMSLKSQSQYSATGSYGNGAPGDETKKSISTVDALHAQHPGVNFNDE